MGAIKREDICPTCGTQLRWTPPTYDYPAVWVCPRCKYKRWEGSQKNWWSWIKKAKWHSEIDRLTGGDGNATN